MATTSFKKREATDAAVETPAVESTEKAVAVREDKTLALPTQKTGFIGAWNVREDVRLPRINLVHKTSDNELIKKFGIGGFCLNKEVKLSDGETPLTVVAVLALKDYVQKLPYGSPEMPAVFKSPEEVEANGGSLNYKDQDSGNFFGPRAHIQFLVAAPEGINEAEEQLFPYAFDGKSYAMAILTVASSAYTSVGKELATLCNNNKVMLNGPQYGTLALTSETRKNAKNSWHIPVIRFTGATDKKTVEFINSLIGA